MLAPDLNLNRVWWLFLAFGWTIFSEKQFLVWIRMVDYIQAKFSVRMCRHRSDDKHVMESFLSFYIFWWLETISMSFGKNSDEFCFHFLIYLMLSLEIDNFDQFKCGWTSGRLFLFDKCEIRQMTVTKMNDISISLYFIGVRPWNSWCIMPHRHFFM